MQSGRYDANALDTVIDNFGLDIYSLPLQGSSDTEEDSVKVFPLCLATSTDSEVKLATVAVYKMKERLKSSLHTDLVGLSSVKLHADTMFRELANVFGYNGKETPFQAKSSSKQIGFVHRRTDPSKVVGRRTPDSSSEDIRPYLMLDCSSQSKTDHLEPESS